jgi:hypothetical protein
MNSIKFSNTEITINEADIIESVIVDGTSVNLIVDGFATEHLVEATIVACRSRNYPQYAIDKIVDDLKTEKNPCYSFVPKWSEDVAEQFDVAYGD